MRRLVFSILLFVALAATSAQDRRDRTTDRQDEARDDASAPIDAAPRRDDYVVGIQDSLEVVVWGEQQLSRTVSVRPDGKITLPLINDIAVEGLTPGQIRTGIAERLERFVRDPAVTVIVSAINSYRVYFLGEVQNQSAVTFYQPTRLLQAIATAGGLTEYANKKITLIREVDGVEQRIGMDYKALLNGDPSVENVVLEPGDMLLFH